jgi:predicted  nucleic acid-binding Zn-ribbon protein
MKTYVLIISVAAALFSCGKKERVHLQQRVDSLSTALAQSKKTEAAMNEVGTMLDSIDANRHALNTKIVEGISYADYITRLKEINSYIKHTEGKLTTLENNLKNTNSSSMATIRRLKSDLEARSKEIVGLQLDVANLREKTNQLETNITKKDSIVSSRDEMIKLTNANVAALEGQVQDTNEKNRTKVASLYYAEAMALETAANRTHFAPRKKKQTRKEALELYRLSFSLGNTDAEKKIQELEKILS